jgi:hypothetical protein
VFWGTLAYTLIGGTFAGTVLTLVFLPALYAIWFKIRPAAKDEHAGPEVRTVPVPAWQKEEIALSEHNPFRAFGVVDPAIATTKQASAPRQRNPAPLV